MITIVEVEGVVVEEVKVVVVVEAKEEATRIRENQHHHINLIEKKVRVVLFYDMNSCAQYKVSTTWMFHSTLVYLNDCPCISYALTYVMISLFRHHKLKTHIFQTIITFDSDKRHDYLTGFSSRKKERRAFGLAMQKVKDGQSKLEERKGMYYHIIL